MKAISRENMDFTVSPSDDFYSYANGNWIKNNPIPPEYPRWGLFEQLHENGLAKLHEIAKTDNEKTGAFFASAMNIELINAEKMKGLTKYFELIEKLENISKLGSVVAEMHKRGIPSFFSFGAEADYANSSLIIAWFTEGSNGLPDRDFYFLDGKEEIRDKYRIHMKNMFKLIGLAESELESTMNGVFEIEKSLAEASHTKVEKRDPKKVYNPMTHNQFTAISEKNFNWSDYCNGIGHTNTEGQISVSNVKFFERFSQILESKPLVEIKNYLRWSLIRSMASYLSDDFVNEEFSFQGKVISGSLELKPRWKRVLGFMNSTLGELLGKTFCDKFFTNEAKVAARNIVSELHETLKCRLKDLDWMEESTKEKALLKCNKFGVKIGFPDKWIDYTTLKVDANKSYVENVLEANYFEHLRDLARINKEKEDWRWEMSPQTVNAYFHPLHNEICFPAAILQFPMFDIYNDAAVNFGAMGGVIAHECTHGYDDQGRKFDDCGNLVDWWSERDSNNFSERSKKIVEQFNKYEVHGKKVNGELTQGENVADLGGVKLAYQAMQRYFDKNGRTPDIDGFTPEQRFFLSWAQIWRQNIRKENAETRLITDPHSPANFRVNGPLSNLPEFHAAFSIEKGSKMYTEESERVVIW